MLSASTAKGPILTECSPQCGHAKLGATFGLAHRYYMRDVRLKKKLKYIEKAGVTANWLLHQDQ